MRNKMIAISLVLISAALLYSCTKDGVAKPKDLSAINAGPAVQWADMTLYTARFSSFNSPTYASRALGYLGLTMYECVVHGDSTHRSLSGHLNGLTLPTPDLKEEHEWVLAMNAGQKHMLKMLYPVPGNSHRYVHDRIDSLAKAIHDQYARGLSDATVTRSVNFGELIAETIYQWSKADGGHEGYKFNFDPSIPFPKGLSFWEPPVRGQTISNYPLHPKWGNNRTFVVANSGMQVPFIRPYSTDTASEYYKLYKAVFDKDKILTQEEMEIAAWWGDDPTETFSPPGHSYHITTLAIKKSGAGIVKAAEAYARTGMAVADAFIQCWKAKVTYYNERPSGFIKANIDPDWLPFWPEPPFPAFPSGHSIQSAAAAWVQTDLFGDNFSFTDSAHTGFRRYDDPRFLTLRYPARHFNSFMEAANECAYSRFLGGIHTMQDNVAGMEQGATIGHYVNTLPWTK